MGGERLTATVIGRGIRLLTVFLVASLTLTMMAGSALAADPIDPYFQIEDQEIALNDGTDSIWVPIELKGVPTGVGVSSAAFMFNFDEDCLTFDRHTDSNNDGVPDSIVQWQSGFDYSLYYFNFGGDSRRDIIILVTANGETAQGKPYTMDFSNDKPVTEVEFHVKETCRTTDGSAKVVDFEFQTNTFWTRIPSASDDNGNGLISSPLSSHQVDGSYTLSFNAYPTGIEIEDSNGIDDGEVTVEFPENMAAASTIGVLSTYDVDTTDTHVYSLVDGCGVGTNDNHVFMIEGDELRNKGPYDYEDDVVTGADHAFVACVRTTDSYGLHWDELLTIDVTDVNEPATEIRLSSWHVEEEEPIGTEVGILSTHFDPDMILVGGVEVPDTHTYALAVVADECNGADNGSFTIAVDRLKTNAEFDSAVKDTYEICVSSTDTGANVIYQPFYISIDDVNEAPTANPDPDGKLILSDVDGNGDPTVYSFDVLANDTDPEGDTLSIANLSTVNPVEAGTVQVHNGKVKFTAVKGYSGQASFQYKANDSSLLSEFATVSFWVVSDEDRGDCNNDSFIDAADFSAIQLEMWDGNLDVKTDGKPDWTKISEAGYAGSPVGCDANVSRNGFNGDKDSVDVADLTCTVRLFFDEECAAIMATAVGMPDAKLTVGSGLQVASGGSVQVPIMLDSAGQNVAAAAFWVKYDASLFSVSEEAIKLNVPESMAKAIDVSQPGIIKVAAFGMSMPFPLLQDGVIATITLQSQGSFTGQSPVELMKGQTSLSDTVARSLPVDIDDGFIVQDGLMNTFLPLLSSTE